MLWVALVAVPPRFVWDIPEVVQQIPIAEGRRRRKDDVAKVREIEVVR